MVLSWRGEKKQEEEEEEEEERDRSRVGGKGREHVLEEETEESE